MRAVAYLNFPGTCAAAFNYYSQHLGAKIIRMDTLGESPMAAQVPSAMHGMAIHARLTIGDTLLMSSDAPPDRYEAPKGTSIALGVDTAEEAERAFAALADGGVIEMPLQQTFWALRFGALIDRFGIPWMVNCEDPNMA